jgi:hypothetical protein
MERPDPCRAWGRIVSYVGSGCVMTAERKEIETWINTAPVLRSPVTNKPMGPHVLPNTTLRNLIRDYCDEHGIDLSS